MLEKILLLHNKTKMAVGETMYKYVVHQSYHKIPKVLGLVLFFQRPVLTGLLLEGVMYGGKFGLSYNWKEIYVSNFARSFS